MIKSILASLIVATLLISCGGTDSPITGSSGASASGTNTTTLDASNLNQIVMTTIANNVGTTATYYHVTQRINNAAGNSMLGVATNYSGTITTTCVRGVVGAVSVIYTCTTPYGQTSAPFNMPDSVRNVMFNIGETYMVNQEESELTGAARVTSVGSFVMQ